MGRKAKMRTKRGRNARVPDMVKAYRALIANNKMKPAKLYGILQDIIKIRKGEKDVSRSGNGRREGDSNQPIPGGHFDGSSG